MTHECGCCGRPTDAYVCATCEETFSIALGDCPWVDDELETSTTRQKAAGTQGSARGTETSLPWNPKAANARRQLLTALSKWAHYCSRHKIAGTPRWHGRDTIPSRSRWLMNCVHGLTLDPRGPEAMREIQTLVAEGERIIFWKRKNRIYLGPCDQAIIDEDGLLITDKCPGDVYAEEGEPVGSCEECEQGVTVAIRKADLEKQLDDRLCTAAEIARLSTYLGLHVDRERVRKQVNAWNGKKIHPSSRDLAGDPMFRYGDVRALLYATYATRVS